MRLAGVFRVVVALASLKLTLASLVVLLISVYLAYQFAGLSEQNEAAFWLLAPPLGLLAVNLIAAILSNRSFRAQPALLLFHLSLLAVVLLVALGQLTNLKGWTEVTSGAVYGGLVNDPRAGWLHPWHIEQLQFVNEGFDIEYAPGPSRRHTFNRIRWVDQQGVEHSQVIGDQVPLQLQGYRFYTSFNKGFAPLFWWRDHQQQLIKGAVHLPAWPEHQFNQSIQWTPPGSSALLWIQLEFDDPILSKDQPSRFRTPNDYQLIVRAEQQRWQLQPGDELRLDEGVLIFQGLTTWMGYSIYYDQTRHWLLAACLLAIASIGWHFWQKYFQRPWQQ